MMNPQLESHRKKAGRKPWVWLVKITAQIKTFPKTYLFPRNHQRLQEAKVIRKGYSAITHRNCVTFATEISIPYENISCHREQRSGNTLYQELSFQDSEAAGEVDEGGDITGNIYFQSCPLELVRLYSCIISVVRVFIFT